MAAPNVSVRQAARQAPPRRYSVTGLPYREPSAPGSWYVPKMANPGVLSPLFTNIPISADDALVMAAALQDIADVDGTHTDERALIQTLVQELGEDLGDTPSLPRVTPKEIAHMLVDPKLRTVFLQSALLLAMEDGQISQPDRHPGAHVIAQRLRGAGTRAPGLTRARAAPLASARGG